MINVFLKKEMSNFEGEYFRYDVGLVNEILDEAPTVENPTNVTSQLLTVNTITGTLSSFEVLEVSVRGQGVSDGKFVVATSADVDPNVETKDGAYVVRVRMTYQPVDGDQVEKIHMLNIPISGDVKINLEKKLNMVRGGPLPAVDATVLNPTGNASKFSISIAVSEVGSIDYINGIEIEDNVLRFKQGFESVGSGGSIIVNLKYTSLTGNHTDGRLLSFVYTPVADDGSQVDQIKSAEVASIKMYGQKTTNSDDKKIFKLPYNVDYEESNDKMAVVIYGNFEFTTNGYTHTGDRIRLVRSTTLSSDESFEVKEVSNSEFKLAINPSRITLNNGQTYHSMIYDPDEHVGYQINTSGYLNYENLLANYSFKLSSENDESGNGYWTADVSLKNVSLSSESETNVKASFGLYDPKGPSSPFRIIYTPATSGSKIRILEEAKFKEVQLEGVVVNDKVEITNFNLICSSYKYINGDNNEISVNTESTLKIVIDSTNDANKLDIVGDDYAFTFSFDEDKYIEINDDGTNLFAKGSKLFIPLGAKLSFRKFAERKYRLHADETNIYDNLGEMTQPQMKWSGGSISTSNWRGIAYGANKFVVVGVGGMYSTSSDGTTWTLAEEPIEGQSDIWNGIAYGADKFVVVGDGGMYSTSSDGTSWTNATKIEGHSGAWRGIAYDGANKFVVVGDGGMYATSSDGVDWKLAEEPIEGQSNTWSSIAYGANKFVVVGTEGKYSILEDGATTWTNATKIEGQSYNWSSIAYGANKFVVVGTEGKYSILEDGATTWTNATKIKGQSYNWRGIAYGANKFVVVGDVGTYSTSSDGTTWTNATTISGQSGAWNSIAYGADKFVIVGDGGKYAIPEDGDISWTFGYIEEGQSNYWSSIAYDGNGKFVAVGDDGMYATSSNGGASWSVAEIEEGQTYYWSSIAYGNGKFVTVGDDGMYATSSNGGASWSVGSIEEGQSDYWTSIACDGNGKFVAVGSSGKYATITTGGTSWSVAEIEEGQSNYWSSIAYDGNGKFVAVGYRSKYAVSSNGGASWSVAEIEEGQSNTWSSIAYGNGKFVAVGTGSKYAVSSNGGASWSVGSIEEGQSNTWNGIAYGNSKFVAVGRSGKYAILEDGGTNWSVGSIEEGQSDNLFGIAYDGNGKFVAVGSNDMYVVSSNITTSASYIGAIPGQLGNWYSIAYGANKFVAVGSSGKYATITTGGTSWTNATKIEGQSYNWYSIAYGADKFVVVGDVGMYSTSSDGTSWTNATKIEGHSGAWSSIAYGVNKFVVVGVGGMYATSSDGVDWKLAEEPIEGQTDSWRGIAYGADKFVVVGDGGMYATSSDGIDWKLAEELIEGQTDSWRGIAYGNGKFVAVGNNGRYAISSDGGASWSTGSITGQPGTWLGIVCRTYNGNYEWIICGGYGLTIRLLDIPAKPLSTVVPLYFKGLSYNQSMKFEALDKSTTASFNPAFTVYEDLLSSGSLLDFTSDAGFVIPIIENGKYGHKYIRISDIYNDIANYSPDDSGKPPALKDRLHACEVALDETCSGTLENEDTADATHLYNIKNKWCVVDIQGLA